MVALDEREARFSHLLQPIRDLAENWDIDVASGLEDYLDELESITISLDGGQTNLNFAEAALLIQGSTCIYSRKVEYLYTLVLQTLEALSTGKYGQAQRGKEGAAADAGAPGGPPADGADEDDEGDDPTLGLLAPPRRGKGAGAAIDLDEEEEDEAAAAAAGGGARSRAVADREDPTLRPQAIYIALDQTDTGAESFKLSSCSVHASGALLVDGAAAAAGALGGLLEGAAAGEGGGGGGAAAERSGVWFEATSSLLEGGRRSTNPDNSDSDDENDGPNFEPGGPAAERSMAMTESSVLLGGGGAAAGQRGAGGGDVAPATPSNKAGGGGGGAGPGGGAAAGWGTAGEGEEEAAAAASPAGVWDLLDPHDPGPAAARRPFRKGKVVQAVPEDCYPEEEDPWAAGDYCDWDAGAAAAAAGEGGGGGGARPTGLAYKEFAYVAQWDRRRRARARRALRRRAAAIAAGGGGGEGGYGSGEEGGEDDDDDVDFGDVGFDPHGGDSDDESQPPLDDPDDDWGLGGGGDGPAPQALDGAFGGIGPTYEELCKQHLEAFLSGAEAYAAAAEGGLAARVQEWQARLGPVLAEQEKRPAFDIHIYGGEIIGSLSSKAPERVQKSIKTQQHDDIDQLLLTNEVFMGFAQVTAGKEQHEICRMFLASLQLANNGNLQLVHGASAESQNDSTFGLRLKSMKAAYELLNDGDASLTQN